jgi:hypothetical protein
METRITEPADGACKQRYSLDFFEGESYRVTVRLFLAFANP